MGLGLDEIARTAIHYHPDFHAWGRQGRQGQKLYSRTLSQILNHTKQYKAPPPRPSVPVERAVNRFKTIKPPEQLGLDL